MYVCVLLIFFIIFTCVSAYACLCLTDSLTALFVNDDIRLTSVFMTCASPDNKLEDASCFSKGLRTEASFRTPTFSGVGIPDN